MEVKANVRKLIFLSLLRKTAVREGTQVPFGQLPFLEYVLDHEGCTQQEIAAALHISAPSASVSLSRMEKAGLIVTKQDPRDLRRNCVAVTEEGKRLFGQGKEYMDAFDHKLFADFTQEQLDTLSALLDQMIFNLTGEHTEPTKEVFQKFKQRIGGK